MASRRKVTEGPGWDTVAVDDDVAIEGEERMLERRVDRQRCRAVEHEFGAEQRGVGAHR